MKFPAGERKKSAKFWAPLRPPNPSGPQPSPPKFGPPTLRAPPFLGSGPHPYGPPPKKKGQMRSGQIRFGQMRPNKDGQIRLSFFVLALLCTLLAFVDGADVHWRWTMQGHDDAAYFLCVWRLRSSGDWTGHTIVRIVGSSLRTCPTNLARRSRRSGREPRPPEMSLASSATLRRRLHVAAIVALNPPRAILTCGTTVGTRKSLAGKAEFVIVASGRTSLSIITCFEF